MSHYGEPTRQGQMRHHMRALTVALWRKHPFFRLARWLRDSLAKMLPPPKRQG